jgi:DnaJ family protein C protein 28
MHSRSLIVPTRSYHASAQYARAGSYTARLRDARAIASSTKIASDPPPSSASTQEAPSTSTPADHSASAKLFADAAREEVQTPTSTRRQPAVLPRGAFAGPDAPWTGEESMQDAVLRMLVDKYRPLRGEFVSADERIRRAPPTVASTPVPVDKDLGEAAPLTAHLRAAAASPGSASATPPPPSGNLANVPLLPVIEGHRPWHTTYVPPKLAASVKLGRIAPSSSRPATATDPDGQPKRKDVEKLRRRMQAVRLTSAREGTLDYKLGLRRDAGLGAGGGPSGTASLRAWNSLVEERIEVALCVLVGCVYFAYDMRRKPGATASSRRSSAAAHHSHVPQTRETLSSHGRSFL